MIHAMSKRPRTRTRSRIAVRARNANIVLLFLVLILMAVTAAMIIRGISTDAAINRARAYSIEVAQIFYSYFSEDLTLVRKAAFSRAITEWSVNEGDETKRANAFHEMMDYVALVPGAHLYLGISASRNEYRITYHSTLEEFVPATMLDPSVLADAWYFKSMDLENDYNLNIGLDTSNNTWHLWINHKVFFEGSLVGIFCSGLRIPDVFYQVFGQRQNIRGYIINRFGVIQLSSVIARIYTEETASHILSRNDDLDFAKALYLYLTDISGLFAPHSQPVVLRLTNSLYGHAAIAPIVRSDWSVVVFYNSHFLSGIADLLPLVIIMVVALILYVVSRNALMNRLIFTPLNLLTLSVSESKSHDAAIYGSSRDDEIGELARTIRNAGHERQQMMKEIGEGSARLEVALEEARAASEAKSNFLANMSHEMRTPLNAVIGLSELTLESGGLSEDVSLNLEKIYSAGSILLSTVNDILDISKIEAGKLALVPVDYDIPSLINDAINQSIIRIGEKPIKFILDIDENLPCRLYGDDLRIRQILNNLLSNALKYTREGTVELRVSCERSGSATSASDPVWMIIRVSDTGPGIRKDDLGLLFLNYTQMDIMHHRKIEGTGLGLPITKRIAEMMDGSISVESEYGKGSVFTVRIRQQFVTDAIIGTEVAKTLKEFRYLESRRCQNSQLVRIKLPYARVLVVDDVAINLDVAKGMMKLYAMQIDCVSSGQEAIDAIRAEKVKYNAIFMDHMMPGMDGIEAVRIIRQEIGTEYAKTIPIIALTANAIVGNEEMFLRNGFQTFLPKPIEMTRLDAVLMEWVRDAKREQTADLVPVDSGCALPAGSIVGLDIEKGLKRFGGNSESYLQILHSYAANIPPLLKTIMEVDNDNLSDYAITVHGIKGASWAVSAGSVGDMAKNLEIAAKEGNIGFVLSKNAAFIKAAENLSADIKAMLEKMPKKPKSMKDKPDRETLAKLLAACEAYDMDGVDAAMSEIEASWYTSDNGLAGWLRENIDKMNFTQVKEKLFNLIE